MLKGLLYSFLTVIGGLIVFTIGLFVASGLLTLVTYLFGDTVAQIIALIMILTVVVFVMGSTLGLWE